MLDAQAKREQRQARREIWDYLIRAKNVSGKLNWRVTSAIDRALVALENYGGKE